MNKLRIALSVLALVFASFAAYSFTRPPHPTTVNPKTGEVWIKFDCKASPGVTFIPGGPNYTTGSETSLPGYSGNCPGAFSICARQYAGTDVINDPNHPGNKIPKAGATVLLTRQCQSIAP